MAEITSRSPLGERGLKFDKYAKISVKTAVAPHTGSVD